VPSHVCLAVEGRHRIKQFRAILGCETGRFLVDQVRRRGILKDTCIRGKFQILARLPVFEEDLRSDRVILNPSSVLDSVVSQSFLEELIP
jgi:hypothetical protein